MYAYGERGAIVAQVTQPDGGTSPTFDYMHNDQVGSVANVTTGSGGGSSQMRFDPFGLRIGTNSPPAQSSNQLPRVTTGFTGQESEDDLGLINMNGRLYDPYLSRFVSADPFVTRPWNSQEYNRYSYANNSPFRFRDTTGFQDDDGGGDEGEGEGEGEGGGQTATPASAAAPSEPAGGTLIDGTYGNYSVRQTGGPYMDPEYGFVAGTVTLTCNSASSSPTDDQMGMSVMSEGRGAGIASAVGLANMSVPIRGTILDPLYGPGTNPATLTMVGAIGAPILAAGVAVGAEAAIPAAEMLAALHPGAITFGTGMAAAQGNTIIIGGGAAGLAIAGGVEAATEAFSYTFQKSVADIMAEGLNEGGYATLDATLEPLQAQLELALKPNRGLVDALLRIDLEGLRNAGFTIPELSPIGREFNMPGGNAELFFPYRIPSEFLSLVKRW